MKNIGSFSNNQANVAHYEETLEQFEVEIIPNDGFYRGGKFEFKVKVKDYPQNPPNVTCKTQIYHPNIDECGEICLNLFNEWAETNTLEDCVQGLLFLLYNPNLEDPLSPWFDPESDTDLEVFAENVRLSLEGGEVEGNEFERNLVNEENDTGDTSLNNQTEERQETKDDSVVVDNEVQVEEENKPTNDSNEELNTMNTTTAVTDRTEATENNTAAIDSNAPTKSEETTDFISGKVNPHRTEDEIIVTKENELL